MAYVGIDKEGYELLFEMQPREWEGIYYEEPGSQCIVLPRGTIQRILGRTITYKDSYIDLEEEYEKCSCAKETILNAHKEGKVVINTVEGPCIVSLEELVDQPVEGILYDLNRSDSITLTFMDDPKWINDFACAQVIRYLKKQLEEHEKNDSTDFLQGQKLEVERLLNLVKGHPLMESSLQGRLSEIEQKLKEK